MLVRIRGASREERRAIIDLAADLSVESGLVLSPLVLDVGAEGHAPEGARGIHERALRDGVPL